MRSKEAQDLFHQAQKDCGRLSCQIDQLKARLVNLQNCPEAPESALSHGRRLIAQAEAEYTEASNRMDRMHPQMMRLKKRRDIITVWAGILAAALLFSCLFPMIGAVAIPSLGYQILAGLGFALTMQFLFKFALVVEILMGDGYHPQLSFWTFIAGLIAVPVLVIGAMHLIGMITVISVGMLFAGVIACIVFSWFIPAALARIV